MTDLRLGDCLDVMGQLADGSIDLVLADLPYGTTACRWDSVIPFEPLWDHYRRLLRPRGAVVLTACEPFTSALVMSNPRWFRYRWTWNKVNRITGYLDAKKRPLRILEDICVFAPGATIFRPQMGTGKPYGLVKSQSRTAIYGAQRQNGTLNEGSRYPTDLLSIKADHRGTEGRVHPTQKPVALMEYLVRTYTDPGATVLDNTMGSGTTGVACVRTDRNFIGIEKDPAYFDVATARIAAEREKTSLFAGVPG